MITKARIAIAVSVVTLASANHVLAAECSTLADMQLEEGRVTSAALAEAGEFAPASAPGLPPGVGAGQYADLPAFCRVQATLTPTPDSDIRIEVWLPAANWNGKYVGIGN